MHPLTDIIVLVHNNLSITQGFVKRLFENTENFHLIFVDNGSTDKVKGFLKEGCLQERWELIRLDDNVGVIKGRNRGAQAIKSDYFLNIDNDQYVKPGWLSSLHKLMDKGYDIVGSEAWQLLPLDTKRIIVVSGISQSAAYFPFRHCSSKTEKFTYIGCGGMLIKREVYDDIGLFDERYSPFYFEDPDYCFSAIKHGYKLGWLHSRLISHLGHQTINNQHLANKNKQFIKSWKLFQEKWYPYFPEPIKMK